MNGKTVSKIIFTGASIALMAMVGLADVPPPTTEAPSAEGIDWFFVLRGVIFISANALIFMWLGRRYLKRQSK